MTNIENEKIIPPPLKLMTKSEVMNDLLKLLSLVQKHADKKGCQHCLDLLELPLSSKKAHLANLESSLDRSITLVTSLPIGTKL
jgi:hypothetical protein